MFTPPSDLFDCILKQELNFPSFSPRPIFFRHSRFFSTLFLPTTLKDSPLPPFPLSGQITVHPLLPFHPLPLLLPCSTLQHQFSTPSFFIFTHLSSLARNSPISEIAFSNARTFFAPCITSKWTRKCGESRAACVGPGHTPVRSRSYSRGDQSDPPPPFPSLFFCQPYRHSEGRIEDRGTDDHHPSSASQNRVPPPSLEILRS